MEPCDLEDLQRALVQQWGMWPVEPKRLARESLIEELGRRVDFLLKHDFDRLMSCMYLLDVPEDKFSAAVQRPEHERPAQALAEIILEREVEKMQTRRRFTHREHTEIIMRIEGMPASNEKSPPRS